MEDIHVMWNAKQLRKLVYEHPLVTPDPLEASLLIPNEVTLRLWDLVRPRVLGPSREG